MTEFFTAVKLSLKKTVLCDNLEEWDGVEGREEVQERESICILMAGSHCCIAKTNTIS